MVVVQRTGRVWLRYEPVASEQLLTGIRQAVSRGAERKVYIRADAHAKYGSVLEVLAVVRSAGIENVVFSGRPARQKPAPPLKQVRDASVPETDDQIGSERLERAAQAREA